MVDAGAVSAWTVAITTGAFALGGVVISATLGGLTQWLLKRSDSKRVEVAMLEERRKFLRQERMKLYPSVLVRFSRWSSIIYDTEQEVGDEGRTKLDEAGSAVALTQMLIAAHADDLHALEHSLLAASLAAGDEVALLLRQYDEQVVDAYTNAALGKSSTGQRLKATRLRLIDAMRREMGATAALPTTESVSDVSHNGE